MEYLEAIIECIGDPIFVKDRQHKFVFVNDAACEMLGIPRERWFGKTDYELFPKEQADIFRRHDVYVFETGEKNVNEEQITDAQGDVRTIVAKKTLYSNKAGEKYIVGALRDITERRRAEEALLESNLKYHTLVESSLAGVYIYQDNLFRFANKRFCEIYGYTHEEIVHKLGPMDITQPEDRNILQEYVSKILAGELDDTGFRHRAIRKDGKTITVNVFGIPVIYKGRVAASGTVLDITEYEKAVEQLREKTALLEAQVNASLDGIIVVEKGKKILQNQQANELLKVPRHIAENDDDEAQIEWVKGLIKNPEEFHEKVAYMLAHPSETVRDELELRDGTVLDGYSSPVIGRDGKYYGRIWTLRDITERKRSEEALRGSQLQLSEAMDLAHIVYWEYNPAVETYIFNDPFYALYGTAAEREGGYRMAREEYAKRFVHPDDLSLFRQRMEQQVLKQEPEFVADFEHRIIRRDGEVRHILARARIVKNESGRIVKIYGANQDITERKKMGEEVLESEEKFRLLFENSADPISLLYEGKFIDCNEAAVKHMQCLSREDLIGLGPADISPDRQPDGCLSSEKAQEIFQATLKEGTNHFEWMCRTVTGDEFWMEVFHTVIPIRGRKIIYAVWRDIRERKRAEEALRESEAFNRRLFESNRTAIVVMDAETTRYIDCNAAAVAIYRCHSRDEVIGKTPLDVSADTQYDGTHSPGKAMCYIREARDNGFVAFEWLHRRPDGQCWDALVHLMSFESRGRRLMQFSLYDITEQKETEEALRRAEGKYRAIFENAIMGIYQTTLQGRILSANAALARIFGYGSPLEMIDSVTDIGAELYVNPQDRSRIEEICREGGFAEAFEMEFHRKDKSMVWVSVNARAIKDAEGDITHFEGTMEDITARKRAEVELKTAHQRLSDIIEFLPDATLVIDNDKKVAAWNLACEEMTGTRKEEIIGKGDYAYAIPFYGEKRPLLIDCITMDSDELQQRYVSIKRKGVALYAESFTPMLHNGRGAFLAGNASPLFDSAGKVVGAIESLRDITEFRNLEAQLLQSQKMQAIGTLAGGIAHDFNNILMALVGYASLLKMKTNEGALHAYVDQILSASHKATDLVQSLLAFSRQQPVSLEPVSIHGIIEGTEKLLKRLVTEDISIKTLLAFEDITIMADRTQIDQILFNLATNARDAMPQGGTLAIETKAVQLTDEFRRFHGYGVPGRYVLLSVSDTGVGMDEATRERIFDPFFTTKEVGKGTGLGLSTVYGIVKQHNGYIIVYSEPGKGTTFHIYLPAVNEIGKREELAPAPARGGSETILVAEDNEVVRGLISTVLIEYGYTTIEAVDGADAVEQFKKADSIDLLILDSVMPKKNGREAYDEIRKIKPDIRVMFTSGYTRDVFLDKGIEDKKFDFLQKPISPDALLQKLREALEDGHASH